MRWNMIRKHNKTKLKENRFTNSKKNKCYPNGRCMGINIKNTGVK